jgi:hypothetical protein
VFGLIKDADLNGILGGASEIRPVYFRFMDSNYSFGIEALSVTPCVHIGNGVIGRPKPIGLTIFLGGVHLHNSLSS